MWIRFSVFNWSTSDRFVDEVNLCFTLLIFFVFIAALSQVVIYCELVSCGFCLICIGSIAFFAIFVVREVCSVIRVDLLFTLLCYLWLAIIVSSLALMNLCELCIIDVWLWFGSDFLVTNILLSYWQSVISLVHLCLCFQIVIGW